MDKIKPKTLYYGSCKRCKEVGGLVPILNSNIHLRSQRSKDFVCVRELVCSLCNNHSFYCLACDSSLKNASTLRSHVSGESGVKHTENSDVLVSKVASSSMAAETVNSGIDDDSYIFMGDDVDEDNGVPMDYDDTSSALDEDVLNSEKLDEWLCDQYKAKNGNLGTPVLSLEDLRERGGFAKHSASVEYYWNQHQKKGLGVKHLVAQAWELSDAESVTDDEAKFSFIMCSLLIKLTEDERKLFAECLQYVVSAHDNESSVFVKTGVPCTIEQFNDVYLKSKNAIIPNLPHPVPFTTNDGSHAYTKLDDVIANMLAASTSLDEFRYSAEILSKVKDENYSNAAAFNNSAVTATNTPAGVKLFMELQSINSLENPIDIIDDEFVLHIWIKDWRDDFDPFNTKASRNQVWTYTTTVCPPPGKKTGKNTKLMAIASKGEDHSEIEKLVQADIQRLSEEGMNAYHGGLKQIVKVKVGRLVTCVDRPEKTSMFRVGDHNGTYSKAWGYAVKVDPTRTENNLPSCFNCRKQRICQLLNHHDTSMANTINPDDDHTPPCNSGSCSNWNLRRLQSQVPAKWPTVFDESENAPKPPELRDEFPSKDNNTGAYIKGVKITAPWLIKAVTFAHHNVRTKYKPAGARNTKRYWTKGNIVTFLKSCGCNNKYIDIVYNSAIAADEKPPIPDTWFPLDVFERCHYAPMHTLFLGHGKGNYAMSSNWLSHHKLLGKFGIQSNKYLRDIQHLRCRQYYDAHPLTTSTWGTGVWVSENYLFWSRVQRFFMLLPAVRNANKKNDPQFEKELRMVWRFTDAAHTFLARMMSDEREVKDIEHIILLFLDTMVEMDEWILNTTKAVDATITAEDLPGLLDVIVLDDDDDDDSVGSNKNDSNAIDNSDVSNGNNTNARETGTNENPDKTRNGRVSNTDIDTGAKKKDKKKKKNKQPSFTKSISLGILEAGLSHTYFGPARLYWEGGWSGEHKIQGAKNGWELKEETLTGKPSP